jgi:hypothetical protein
MLARVSGNGCVWEPSSEADLTRGGVSPRARQTSLKGGLCCVTLVGRGGHHGDNRVVCVCQVRGLVYVLRFSRGLSGFPLVV